MADRPPSASTDRPGFLVRAGSVADAESLGRAVVAGFEGYASFSAPGWTPPSLAPEVERLRGLLGDQDVWCRAAERDDQLAGHVLFLPGVRAYHPIDHPGVAHLRNLFISPHAWGTGLATALLGAAVDAAGERGFAEMRLFVPAGQARARRFYEREGWAAAGEPFHDAGADLVLVEYRRGLPTAGPRIGS